MRRMHSPIVKPGTRPVLPGRVMPTWHDAQWPVEARTEDIRLPNNRDQKMESLPGRIICPVCHAISDGRHWLLDEDTYQKLRQSPDVRVELCPADQKILRQMYDGEIVLQGGWLDGHKAEVLNWVRNEERRARDTNPLSRLASVEERDGSIYILTTSQSLARRIGAGLKSAFKGRLKMQKLPYEAFTRVRWARD